MEKRKILAIDGGGIKGVVPAAFLAAIERSTQKRIADHFDLIAGTSTGGIIAIGLGLGLPASQILEFYIDHGPDIFDQKREGGAVRALWALVRRNHRSIRRFIAYKYKPTELRIALSKAFGDHMLGDSRVRLVVPSYHPLRREVYVFKTSHHPRLEIDWKERAVDVALATTAAPTYFPGHKIPTGATLIDGGIWANNPAGMATVEAVGLLEWSRPNLYVLNLGCGDDTFIIPEAAGYKDVIFVVDQIFMQGQARGSIGTAKLLTGHTEDEPRLYRYSPLTEIGTFEVDTVKEIDRLRGLGEALAREALPAIRKVFLSECCESFKPYYRAASEHVIETGAFF